MQNGSNRHHFGMSPIQLGSSPGRSRARYVRRGSASGFIIWSKQRLRNVINDDIIDDVICDIYRSVIFIFFDGGSGQYVYDEDGVRLVSQTNPFNLTSESSQIPGLCCQCFSCWPFTSETSSGICSSFLLCIRVCDS